MQIHDFERQPFSIQAHLICRHGVYLSERAEGTTFVALYALFGFYVEVCYNPDQSEVISISGFHQARFLEPYLSRINLQPVLGALLP